MNSFKLKLNKIYHIIFGEKFYKKIDFEWEKYSKRYEIINQIIKKKNYKTYLEIGCDENKTFNEIKINEKIGIDPIRGGNIRVTSDDFFLNNEKKFDCIFIDGLHEYTQVKKDINNSVNCLNPNGIILVHDCLPQSFFHQAVPRCRSIWNGDVWKAIVEFRTKTNLDIYTCLADQGIGVILKRANTNVLVKEIKNFKSLKFKEFYFNHKKLMNIIDIDNLYKILEL
tara:strand:- start:1885 stop:2562 length:678 start_codon:yes stop_codon:yes gene_type:complete